jgi:hypothetical protein
VIISRELAAIVFPLRGTDRSARRNRWGPGFRPEPHRIPFTIDATVDEPRAPSRLHRRTWLGRHSDGGPVYQHLRAGRSGSSRSTPSPPAASPCTAMSAGLARLFSRQPLGPARPVGLPGCSSASFRRQHL